MRFLALFIPFLLIAKILSPLQESLLNFDKQKAVISGDKLKDSWINPITLQYKYNRSNQTGEIQTINQFIISINQPIFKSGAIWASVEYAKHLKLQNLQRVKLQKRTLIKQAYELLFNIHKLDISIQKQKLLIDNAIIDIQRKKEQFLSGVGDSSLLDNAILNKNNLELALKDIVSKKEELINSFKTLSDIDYKKIDSIVIGTFRMNSTQFKNIKKSGFISDILYYDYDVRNGVVSYKDDKEIEEYIKSLLPNVKMVELWS
jgi:hypothetical protein